MVEDLIDEFAEVVNAAFQGDESGRIYAYLYKDPRPDHINDQALDVTLNNASEYYIYQNGLNIIDEHKSTWAEKFGEGRTYIELGIGSKAALIKTKKLIEVFKPSVCIVNDQSPGYVAHAETELSQWAYEQGLVATINGMVCDFTDPSIDWSTFKNPIVVLQGCTIQNYDNVQDILKTLARIAGPNGDILLDYDTNKDHEHLKRAYGSAYQIAHRKEILQYVKEIFNPEGFKPDTFYWQSEWRADKNLLLQKLICDTPQSFTIKEVHHENVREIVISKMYKNDPEGFLLDIKASGLRREGLYFDQDSLVVMEHVKPQLRF